MTKGYTSTMFQDELTLCVRGTFLEVLPEDCSHPPMLRSVSEPALKGCSRVRGASWESEYLEWLPKRAEQLSHVSCCCFIDHASNQRQFAKHGTRSNSLQMCGVDDHTAPEITDTFEFQGGGCKPITTLMLCCIPLKLSIHEVVEAIDGMGYAKTYDLVYLPTQKGVRHPSKEIVNANFGCTGNAVRKISNLGYAFVNFKDPEHARGFMVAVSDQCIFSDFKSKKTTYAKPARCQGYAANIMLHHKQHTGCMLTFTSEKVFAPGRVNA